MKAAPQDAASSSSSSLAASNVPNPVLLPRTEGIVTDLLKSTMCDDHFELGTNKYDKLHISTVPSLCLDFSKASECKKGICIPPKETFVYTPKGWHAVYICEAGLPEHQAESLENTTTIQVHVKSGGEDQHKILIGILSKKHPSFNLAMVLPDEFELSHNADRKSVYFNIYELGFGSPLMDGKLYYSAYNTYLKTKKVMWGAEVAPSQKPEFRPIADGKVYNILKVFSETTSNEDIQLFVESEGITKSLGTISAQKPSIECELEFDDTFQLSHSSSDYVVFFSGFTISFMSKLKGLTRDPSPFFHPLPSKKIVDGEYYAHQGLLAKKTSGAKIRRVNLVPMLAPVIRGFPAESLEDKDTDAGGTRGPLTESLEDKDTDAGGTRGPLA